MKIKQKVTPFLTYKHEAEQAAAFYTKVVPDSKILRTVKNPDTDAVLTVEFELAGLKFVALNSGQDWKFTEAFSLSVACDDQDEIDRLWDEFLADGGTELACGWLKDRFGMCWQVVPALLDEWFAANQPENLQRMFQALWQMKKLNLAELQRAFQGNA